LAVQVDAAHISVYILNLTRAAKLPAVVLSQQYIGVLPCRHPSCPAAAQLRTYDDFAPVFEKWLLLASLGNRLRWEALGSVGQVSVMSQIP